MEKNNIKNLGADTPDYRIQLVHHYLVNGVEFTEEEDAKSYALRLFIAEQINKIWKNDGSMTDYSLSVEDDYKTLLLTYHVEPTLKDSWNLGNYGCHEEYQDNNVYTEYYTIESFYSVFKDDFKKIFETADSINIDLLDSLCTKDVLENMKEYKNMANLIREEIASKK